MTDLSKTKKVPVIRGSFGQFTLVSLGQPEKEGKDRDQKQVNVKVLQIRQVGIVLVEYQY